MSDESGTSGAAPPSSGEMDRGAGEHDVQDVELVRQRQELNEARERLTRHRRDLMAYDERLEERRQEIDQDIQELNDYRRGLVRYRERLRILRRG